MTNEELLKILDANPSLRSRVEALAELSQGSLNNEEIAWGDTAKDLIAKEVYGLGHDVLEKWANSRSNKVSTNFKNELKDLNKKSKKKDSLA
jgi:hypothetical protein